MSAEVTISIEREELIYADGFGEAHILTSPQWTPANLDYLGRARLTATLRAIADVVDPGTFDDYLERVRVRSGAEKVERP